MPVHEWLQTVKCVQKQEGWRKGGAYFAALIFDCYRAYLFRISLDKPVQLSSPRPGLAHVPLSPHSLPLLADLVPPFRLKRFARKLAAGETGHIAIYNGIPVAYGFTAYAGTPSTQEIPISLSADDAYHWGAYCRTQYRSSGIMTGLGLFSANFLQEQGFQAIYQSVKAKNRASLRFSEKIGAELVGHFTVIKLFNWQKIIYQPPERL